MDNNNDVVEKMSKFSKIMGIVGVCLIGLVPAFGMMAIAVPIVFKTKGVKLNENESKMCKLGVILGIISLILFVIDFILALVLL